MPAEILTETEGLTKEMWLTYRRMGIGGSDVAPLLGLSKWKSELELWLDKTGQAEELEGENEAMLWGNIMEPILRSHFEEVTGRKAVEVKAISRQQVSIREANGRMKSLCITRHRYSITYA